MKTFKECVVERALLEKVQNQHDDMMMAATMRYANELVCFIKDAPRDVGYIEKSKQVERFSQNATNLNAHIIECVERADRLSKSVVELVEMVLRARGGRK